MVPPLDPSAGRACSRCGTTSGEVHDSARGPLCFSCFTGGPRPARAIEPKNGYGAQRPPSQPVRLSGPGSSAVRLSGPSGAPYGSLALKPPPDTIARVRSLGIAAPLLQQFRCVLPGHDHQARVHPTGTAAGFWRYTCDGGGDGYGLAEVRAFLGYGSTRRISGTEAARWRERLDYEAGVLGRGPLRLLVPDCASSAARFVATGIGLLVGLRDPRWPQTEPFVFAREFAMAWCCVSSKVARNGIAELEGLGLIERAGRTGRALLWRLPQTGVHPTGGGGAPPRPPESAPPATGDGEPPDEEGLIAALIVAFDAEEVPEEPPEASRASGAADGPPPCPYEQHRQHHWLADGGRRVCGVCHPPADPAWGGAS